MESNASLRVKDLLNAATGEWDIDAIRLHLPQYEDHIRRIILPSFSLPDKLVWLFSRSRTYTTKSSYATIKVNSITEPANPGNFNWNTCIWQVNTTPKVKHFLWKSLNGALPVDWTPCATALQLCAEGMGINSLFFQADTSLYKLNSAVTSGVSQDANVATVGVRGHTAVPMASVDTLDKPK